MVPLFILLVKMLKSNGHWEGLAAASVPNVLFAVFCVSKVLSIL